MYKKIIILVSFYLRIERIEATLDVDHFNVGFLGKHGGTLVGHLHQDLKVQGSNLDKD